MATLAAAGPAQEVHVRAGADVVGSARLEAVHRFAVQGLRRLSPMFAVAGPAAPLRVVVHEDESSLEPALQRNLHPGTAGLALLERDEIHLILRAARVNPPNDLRTVVDHELVHILLHRAMGAAGPHVPRWFHEGLAQSLSEGVYLGASEDDLVFWARTDMLLPWRDLEQAFPHDPRDLRLAYGQSFSFVSWLGRHVGGLHRLLDIARGCGPDTTFGSAYGRITNEPFDMANAAWIRYLKYDSGAIERFVGRHCFDYLLILAVPLLVLAVARRLNRDHRKREVLVAAEAEERLDPALVAAALRAGENENDDDRDDVGEGEENFDAGDPTDFDLPQRFDPTDAPALPPLAFPVPDPRPSPRGNAGDDEQ